MRFLVENISREKFIIENGHHKRNSVIIVLEGVFTCTAEGKTFVATDNDVCVFPKTVLFSRQVIKPLKCIYLQFDEFPLSLPFGLLPCYDLARKNSSVSLLKEAVETQNLDLCEHYLKDIFLLYSSREEKEMKDEIILGCTKFFEDNLEKSITIEELSQKFNISAQGLIKKFKKHLGKTPMDYLFALRITRGKEMLKNTDLPIFEIAERCGFKNGYYFSNFFKKKVGISPSSYRKMFENL